MTDYAYDYDLTNEIIDLQERIDAKQRSIEDYIADLIHTEILGIVNVIDD